jgi:hypothetical protein
MVEKSVKINRPIGIRRGIVKERTRLSCRGWNEAEDEDDEQSGKSTVGET